MKENPLSDAVWRKVVELEDRVAMTNSKALEELLGEVCPDTPGLRDQVRDAFHLVRRFEQGHPANGEDQAEPPPNTPRYQFEEIVGRGGMGEVWRGRDTLLEREVAIKLLRQGFGRESRERRFRKEARILGGLNHPGVAALHDYGQLPGPDPRPFLVMKFVRGRTLGEVLRGRASPTDDLMARVQEFEQVCETVAYAHRRGVVHRDLKPSNIMVGEFGEVQVMDWGLAKVLGEDPGEEVEGEGPGEPIRQTVGSGENLTRAGVQLGTYGYMPPEQSRGDGERIDQRADVFSLGAILCEILTGQPPYAGHGQTETEGLTAGEGLTGVGERLAGCRADPELVDLVRRCLQPDPRSRPAHAGELAEAVAAYRLGLARPLEERSRGGRERPRVQEGSSPTSRPVSIPRRGEMVWPLVYLLLTMFVGLASAADAYLNLKYPVTATVEENPLARSLLEHSDNDLALLLGSKFAGTVVALGLLWGLYHLRRTWGWVSVSVLTAMQTAILLYMTDGVWPL